MYVVNSPTPEEKVAVDEVQQENYVLEFTTRTSSDSENGNDYPSGGGGNKSPLPQQGSNFSRDGKGPVIIDEVGFTPRDTAFNPTGRCFSQGI